MSTYALQATLCCVTSSWNAQICLLNVRSSLLLQHCPVCHYSLGLQSRSGTSAKNTRKIEELWEVVEQKHSKVGGLLNGIQCKTNAITQHREVKEYWILLNDPGGAKTLAHVHNLWTAASDNFPVDAARVDSACDAITTLMSRSLSGKECNYFVRRDLKAMHVITIERSSKLIQYFLSFFLLLQQHWLTLRMILIIN